MDIAAWKKYRRATGARKRLLQSQLMAGEEGLVKVLVDRFMKVTEYVTEAIREDLTQAARIGVLDALDRWVPRKGAFSTIAGFRCWYEMQEVMKHATPVSHPPDAELPGRVKHAAAVFYAQHGRMPEPKDLGVSVAATIRSQKARASFVSIDDVDIAQDDYEGPEVHIDRARDVKALEAYLKDRTARERSDFWAGKRPDLVAGAKAYVEQRRKVKGV